MALIVGSARIDENGNIAGGAAGDQTGQEVSTQAYYMHASGWYCLRPKSVDIANKIATAMQQACDNSNIGYDQNQRLTAWTALKTYGSLGAIPVKCECDCSSLVRCCIYQASGKDVGNINTSSEASALEASGLFESRFSVSSESQLYNGDVLVTKVKGHTVVVVSGRPRSGGSSSGDSSSTWKATGTATCTDDAVNVRSGAGTNYTSYGKLNKGNRFEVDGQTSNGWVHIKVNLNGSDVIGWMSGEYVKYDQAPATETWKATGTATCTDNGVNVRKTPNGTVIGQVGKGNRFEVDGKVSGDWVHVNVAGIGIGYIHKDYVKYDVSASTETWKATGTATCTDNSVNVRSTPSDNGTSNIIGSLNKGNRFEVDGKTQGGWVHVKVAGIGIGWVYGQYVKSDASSSVDSAESKNDSLAGTYQVVNTGGEGLTLRAGAGTDKSKITVIPDGGKVQNYGYYTKSGGHNWLYVTYNGSTGFVCDGGYLKKL